MGHRNPDRVPLKVRYARGRTVGDMIREGWEVIACCRSCQLMMVVDLRIIAIVRGPAFILWNQHGRCKRLLCDGVVDFHAKAPGMVQHERLTIDDKLPG